MRWAYFAAVGALGLGQAGIRHNPNDARATLLFVAAAALAAFAAHRCDPNEARTRPPRPPEKAGVSARVWLLVGLGAAAMALGSALLAANWARWFAWGIALLLFGTGLLCTAMRTFDRGWPQGPEWPRWEIPVLLAILGLGAVLRFHHYGAFPGPYTTHAIEEQQTGLGAHHILTRGARPWEFFFDLYAAAFALWLSDEPTFVTLRIPFTAFSALAVLPAHLLLRQLLPPAWAAAGSFLYAVSSWNLLYSRCAHNIFLTNFFVLSVFAALVHFGRTRRLAGIALAGLFCGYTLYAYAGYRGTPLFALLFLLGLLGADLYRWLRATTASTGAEAAGRARRDLAALALACGGIAAMALPLVVLLRADRARPDYYFEAFLRSYADKAYYAPDPVEFARQRLRRIRDVAAIFTHHGDDSPTFNAPGEPMLDPVTASGFAGGLLLALLRWRAGYNGFLLFAFAALLAGGTVVVHNLDVRRLQGITVFPIFFTVQFGDCLWRAARGGAGPRVRRVLLALAVAAGGFAGWWNYSVYFRKMARDPRVREAFHNRDTILIRYARERARGHPIFLLSPHHRFFDPSFYYAAQYAWLKQGVVGQDLGDLLEILSPGGVRAPSYPVFIALQRPFHGPSIAELLGAAYPELHCGEFSEPDNPHIGLTSCELQGPARPRQLRLQLRARYWLGEARGGPPILVRDEPLLSFALVPRTCREGIRGQFCAAEWEGEFEVSRPRAQVFIAEALGQSRCEVEIDGRPVTRTPLALTAGAHEVRARAVLPRDPETGCRLLAEEGGRQQLVPFYRVEASGGAGTAPG